VEFNMKFKEIDLKLKDLVRNERKITAEIISVICDIDKRKLFLELGSSSLFAYLTKKIGYSASAAQRRIEAARLSKEIPEIKEKLKSGTINLSTITLVTQGLREKAKNSIVTLESKKALILKIENKNTQQAQKILAEELDLPIVNLEKTKIQKDESIRIELTLSKVQNEKLERVRQLTSHIDAGLNWSELIEQLADFYLNKKTVTKRTSDTVVKNSKEHNVSYNRYIPLTLRRKIFERDRSCQWKHSKAKEICGSKHQLEIHHQKAIWAGGISSEDNLQLLCRAHNAYTYRNEAQIKLL